MKLELDKYPQKKFERIYTFQKSLALKTIMNKSKFQEACNIGAKMNTKQLLLLSKKLI